MARAQDEEDGGGREEEEEEEGEEEEGEEEDIAVVVVVVMVGVVPQGQSTRARWAPVFPPERARSPPTSSTSRRCAAG
jgi:hypothetical protein